MKIKLENKTIEIKKLPIGKYSELLNAVQTLPNQIQDLGSFDNATVISKLPQLIAGATPDFVNIVTIATELEKEEVEQLGLDEFVDIILAIIEVNNYKKVFDKVKKALARPVQEN